MNLLVVYDVATTTSEGKRRLRAVAKVCEGFGQRVQYSVFEVSCSPTDFAKLYARLLDKVKADEDRLRIYSLPVDAWDRVMLIGSTMEIPQDDPWTL